MFTTLLVLSSAGLSLADLVGDGIVAYSITAKLAPITGIGVSINKRQDLAELANQQTGTSYTIDLNIGTPAQPVTVQLDTGSTDLWVNPNCAAAGSQTSIDFCNSLPVFDPSTSTSYKDLGTSYNLVYGAGSATVEWSTDDVSVGSATLTAQQFGVASDSSHEPFGILGVGPKTFDTSPDYTYFIDNLVKEGFTQSRAYGLDIRSIESPDGSIVFGGLDTGKFQGSLEKIPIIPANEAPNGDRYWVNLNGMGLSSGGKTTTLSTSDIPVILDSGSTLMRLPQDVYTAFGDAFPTAQLDSGGSGFYVVDCSVSSMPGFVSFTFGGKVIQVLFKDVIWNVQSGLCALGAQGIPTTESPQLAILGDSFLRAAYAVFDQDNDNVHLAQADNCGTNLVAISTGPDAVPSVTGDCAGTQQTPPPSSSSTILYGNGTMTKSSGSYTTSAPIYVSSYPNGGSYPTYTATYYTTTCYTVTECPAGTYDCGLGIYTTETLTSYATYCPEKEGEKPSFYPIAVSVHKVKVTAEALTAYPTEAPCQNCGSGATSPAPAGGEYPTGGAAAPTYPASAPTYVATAGVGRTAAQAGIALLVAAVVAWL